MKLNRFEVVTGRYIEEILWHCAWRGDPDYRDVGDERFP